MPDAPRCHPFARNAIPYRWGGTSPTGQMSASGPRSSMGDDINDTNAGGSFVDSMAALLVVPGGGRFLVGEPSLSGEVEHDVRAGLRVRRPNRHGDP